jgi:hypothetical protein
MYIQLEFQSILWGSTLIAAWFRRVRNGLTNKWKSVSPPVHGWAQWGQNMFLSLYLIHGTKKDNGSGLPEKMGYNRKWDG